MNDERTQQELEEFEKDPVKAMADSKGSIVIIPHTAATATNRVEAFKEESMKRVLTVLGERGMTFEDMGNGLHSDEKTNDNFFAEGQKCANIESAYEEARKLLGEDGNKVKVVFTTNTNTTIGVANYIAEKGLGDHIYMVGFNADGKEIKHLRTKVIDGLVVQNPYNMGYVSVNYARKIMDGEKVGTMLDTGVTFVTADNMNDEYIRTLLPEDEDED